jgi:hypothetical protein
MIRADRRICSRTASTGVEGESSCIALIKDGKKSADPTSGKLSRGIVKVCSSMQCDLGATRYDVEISKRPNRSKNVEVQRKPIVRNLYFDVDLMQWFTAS